MTAYVTKVWGFGAPTGPLQFSQPGWRDKARSELRPGDLVILVGTVGENTREGDRGKILGMMEPTTDPVSCLDYALERGPQDFDEEGSYRWPYGLTIKRAWQFTEPRTAFHEVSDRQFNMDSALGIVPLTAEEADRVMRLPKEECSLLQPIKATARVLGGEAARRKGAPPPSTTRTGIMHMRRAPAYTYAMEIEGPVSSVFKIGWAFDVKMRSRQFNLYALPELGGFRYRPHLSELWATAFEAYRMEQAVLLAFDGLRHPSNREVLFSLRRDDLERAWRTCMMEVRGAR